MKFGLVVVLLITALPALFTLWAWADMEATCAGPWASEGFGMACTGGGILVFLGLIATVAVLILGLFVLRLIQWRRQR